MDTVNANEVVHLTSAKEVEEALAKGIHPDRLFKSDGRPMLTDLILNNHVTTAMAMLHAGANPMLTYGERAFDAPISAVIHTMGHPEIFDLMLRDGRVLQASRPSGANLLHDAAGSCAPPVLLALVQRGFDVNAPDRYGARPLRYAINACGRDGYYSIRTDGRALNVRALLALGAEPVPLLPSELNFSSSFFQDTKLALTQGRLVNAVLTHQSDQVRHVLVELGPNIDADDLAQARKAAREAPGQLKELHEAIGPFADAVMARSAIQKIVSGLRQKEAGQP